MLLESIAVFFGLMSVWYARKEKIAVYPTGIISVLIYVFIFYKSKVYADAGINFFYFMMSVYGWHQWTHVQGKISVREISRTSFKEKILYSILLIISFVVLYLILKRFTDSNIPVVDSLVSSIFIVAMLQMAFKKIENWTMWIVGDFISIPLFIYKQLYITSFQYLVFMILAVLGYLEWKRRLSTNLENNKG